MYDMRMMAKSIILCVSVLVLVSEAKISQHNKHHQNGINQMDQLPQSTEGAKLEELLPEVVAPQVPIFLRKRSKTAKIRDSEEQCRLFKYGDIEALMLQGFMIPIVKPQGNLTNIPLPSEDPQSQISLVDEGHQDIGQRETRENKDVQLRGSTTNPAMKITVSSGSDPLMCGNYEVRHDTGITIQTPYYPANYASNFKCRWVLSVVNGDAMMINCPDFQLARGDIFTTSVVGTQKSTKRYAYKKGPVNEILQGNTVRLFFSSNKRQNTRGFHCKITAIGGSTTSTATTPKPETSTLTTTSSTTSTSSSTTTTTTSPTTTTTISTTSTSKPSNAMTTTSTTTTTTSPTTTTTVSTTTLPPLSHPDCGITNRNRIVNGQPAKANEYPWQSFLEMKWNDGKNQLCGGSLITKQWILTAGHCVLRKDDDGNLWKPTVTVTLGMHSRTTPLANNGFKVTAAAVEIHPKNNFAYDLALIKLPEEVDYRREVRPVCLPNRDLMGRNVTGVLMALIGWGKTETGKLTDELRELSRYGIESAICKTVFGSYITDHHFCTSGVDVKHICLGDSGGPVMTVNRGRFTLTGVVSFVATSDCKGEYPDGHISVVHFLDWIQEVTKQVLY